MEIDQTVQEKSPRKGSVKLPQNIVDKVVKIECEAAALMDIDEMSVFQDDLKEISEVDFAKLIKSIIDLGYSFPQYIWKDGDGINNIIGGTHRLKALKYLRENGWKVPKVPINWIYAKNRVEAKKKLLMEISQFASTTQDGLYSFISDIPDFRAFVDDFKIPDFQIEQFKIGFLDFETPPVDIKEGEVDENLSTDHECPQCGYKW